MTIYIILWSIHKKWKQSSFSPYFSRLFLHGWIEKAQSIYFLSVQTFYFQILNMYTSNSSIISEEKTVVI